MPSKKPADRTQTTIAWKKRRKELNRPMQIGHDRIKNGGTMLSYIAAEALLSENGWVSADDVWPPEYELVWVQTPERIKPLPLWRQTNKWSGARGNFEMKGTKWKRKELDGERYEQ